MHMRLHTLDNDVSCVSNGNMQHYQCIMPIYTAKDHHKKQRQKEVRGARSRACLPACPSISATYSLGIIIYILLTRDVVQVLTSCFLMTPYVIHTPRLAI